jgi:hypothetical protein
MLDQQQHDQLHTLGIINGISVKAIVDIAYFMRYSEMPLVSIEQAKRCCACVSGDPHYERVSPEVRTSRTTAKDVARCSQQDESISCLR